MHPLVTDMSSLKDSELENIINDLSKKYFQTSNPTLQSQIQLMLSTYKGQLATRRHEEWLKMNESRDKTLDKLINVD
jgi:hypothetical protein